MNYRAVLIAAAQTLGLFLAGVIHPIGQLLALFTPVPLILISVRYGSKDGLITLALTSAIMAALGGWEAAAVLVLSFGLMAIGTSEGLRRNWKPEQTSLMGGLLPMAVLAIIVVSYLARMGKNPITEVEVYLREVIATAAKTYTTMGFTEMAATISSIPDRAIHTFARLLPGIIIAISLVQAACCFIIARAMLMRKPIAGPVLSQTSLASWHAPDTWVWGLIAALALIVVPQETARLTGWNLAILFAVLYLAQGSAIVEHYLRKAGIKTMVRGLLLAFILAMPSIVFVIALGIVDIWTDFRKVRMPTHVP
jgi:uncharacterized protein YybS (DUF2232 family)